MFRLTPQRTATYLEGVAPDTHVVPGRPAFLLPLYGNVSFPTKSIKDGVVESVVNEASHAPQHFKAIVIYEEEQKDQEAECWSSTPPDIPTC